MPARGPVPTWPTVVGTYNAMRTELNKFSTPEEKIAILAYWDSLIHSDMSTLATTGQLGPAPTPS